LSAAAELTPPPPLRRAAVHWQDATPARARRQAARFICAIAATRCRLLRAAAAPLLCRAPPPPLPRYFAPAPLDLIADFSFTPPALLMPALLIAAAF